LPASSTLLRDIPLGIEDESEKPKVSELSLSSYFALSRKIACLDNRNSLEKGVKCRWVDLPLLRCTCLEFL